jgi:hypothetical protein
MNWKGFGRLWPYWGTSLAWVNYIHHYWRQNVLKNICRLFWSVLLSKLAEHGYGDTYQTDWNEARILQVEINNMHREHKGSAHMVCLTDLIGQPSLDIPPMDSLYQQGG